METLHHVHAEDVAQAFAKAIENRPTAIGQAFHVVSAQAVTVRGYAEAVASWFGKKANLDFVPWDKWKLHAAQDDATGTYDHLAHSPNCSIEKAQKAFGYQPHYSSLAAIRQSLDWLIQQKILKVPPLTA